MINWGIILAVYGMTIGVSLLIGHIIFLVLIVAGMFGWSPR